LLVLGALAEVYFQENFDEGWEDRWVKSKNKEAEGTQGTWVWTAGKYFGDASESKGIQTSPDARFHQISASFNKFSNRDKTLVLQYSVKNEQKLDCGGGYIKILPSIDDQENFSGDTKYNIMFGPDQCGSTKRVHVIFTYNGKNHLISKEPKPKIDQLTHVYTLIVKPDQTYSVLVDGEELQSGSLTEDWDFLPPKMIKDPTAEKPKDWVDQAEIPDPDDVKPEGYDDIPETITDPDASKPEDWDDELDGDWEAPQIPNPDYKGPWRPKKIPNPDYKGPWIHPEIENPDYYEDSSIYAYDDNAAVGFELWQVLSGTIFDNILVTDDEEYAEKERKRIAELQAIEKEAHEALEEEERKKREEERKATEGQNEDGEDFDFADLDMEMDDLDFGEGDHDEL
jgi:calreticulin